MIFLALLAIPLLVAAAGFIFLHGITWKEFMVQVLVQLLVAGASAGIIYQANTYDVEILNGSITGKNRTWVSCSHGYPCNCHEVCTGSGKDRSCSTHCDTCYEHTNDWDWDVYSTVGEFTIDRIDRRGSHEPPRWSAVVIGEPAAITHGYTNYVKAAPGTLFRHQGQSSAYRKYVPSYPDNVYDYYRLRRLVQVNGIRVKDQDKWNDALSDLNARLGAIKQANMVLVLVRGLPSNFFYTLEEMWIGGKKNDTVLVIGVTDSLAPTWAGVMSWTKNELLKVKLRDDVMELKVLTPDAVMNVLGHDVSTLYERRPMSEFEYLSASVTPTTSQWVWSLLVGLLIAGGLAYLMHREEFLDGDNPFEDVNVRNHPWTIYIASLKKKLRKDPPS